MNLDGLTVKRSRKGVNYCENKDGHMVAKVCTKCSEWKSLSEFFKNREGLGGVKADCRTCNMKKRRKSYEENKEQEAETRRRYYENNKEWLAEYRRKYDTENKERKKELGRRYYADNKERIKERVRRYREENKESRREYRRNWVRDNYSKVLLNNQIRRARKASLPNTLTTKEYAKTLTHFGNACALTGRTGDVEIEHAIPISSGHGGTIFENCYPLTKALNISKSNSNIFEWFEANRQRFNLEQSRFDRLIEWLGKANGMTVEEYRDYVYWCHANPRSLDELKAQ